MIARVVGWSVRRARLVIAVFVLVAVAGAVSWRALRKDGIPDVSDPQIVLVADWMGHSAEEVASQVTTAMTRAIDGVGHLKTVRGTSMPGMAYVDAVFDAPGALESGRAEIIRRLRSTPLPPDARLETGPLASSTGWVFEYALIDPHRKQSAVALRAWQEDVLRPALERVPGVAEVATVGGGVQQILVELEAERLHARRVSLSDVVGALRPALATTPPPTPKDLEAVVVPGTPPDAPPVKVGDVGHVHATEDMPTGLADFRAIQPTLGGVVVARRDADVTRVVQGVRAVLDGERARLPPGVELMTAYDRSGLVARVSRTLGQALVEEIMVVGLVVLVFLLHARSALVAMTTLPIVLLATCALLWLAGAPGTIMSLGGVGIALGMAVDADIVALEACHRELERMPRDASPAERRAALLTAAGSFAPAVLTSLVIAALTFLPVFAFTGESGRLLHPLAFAKTLVIGAAALVSLTLAPALRERWLRGPVVPEFDHPLTRALVRAYQPFVYFALSRPALTLVTALVAVASAVPVAYRLGGEFLPRMDEGDLLFMPTTRPGIPADLAANQLFQQDRALRRFPEVGAVLGKVGRADSATDPAPYSMAETTIALRPRSEWPLVTEARWYSGWAPAPLRKALSLVWPEARAETRAELVDKLDRATRLPGWVSAWTAPARARMDMMATGVRTPVGLRIVSDDPKRLDALGAALRSLVAEVPGTRSASFESMGGEARLVFVSSSDLLAQRHVDPGLARATADLVIAGGQIGEVEYEGRRVRVRVAPDVSMPAMMPGPMIEGQRGPADQLREATVRASDGSPVPLALLGSATYAQRPSSLRSERGESVAYVHVDLADGTDVARYVDRARAAVDGAVARGRVALDAGERIEWTGQYDLLVAGERRLRWIAPAVLVLMFALLYAQFRSVVEALIVLTAVPFALVGSLWTLYALGYALSAPVWVGLLSVVGLAMQTGVLMVVYIDDAFHRRVREGRLETYDDIVAAHAEGTVRRLRPKIMTVTTMAASLLPLLWAEGAGAEILRRIAAPMLGGLVTSALLTLEVLPVVYTLWRAGQLRRARASGVPLVVAVAFARPARPEPSLTAAWRAR